MTRQGSRARYAATLLVLTATLGACSDRLVYRDREVFQEPPAGAGEFLGYSDDHAKQTTCGNCHVGKQALWRQTAHADAAADLLASPAYERFCESCHTVSKMGNPETADSVGWVGSRHPRYKDVQCESCHGPGLTHVLNPDQPGTKPLATLAVDTGLTRGCGECHSGTHTPFLEEWRASRHAKQYDARSTMPSCVSCHEAKGILQSWGVRSTFAQETGTQQYQMVTCAVCHDPHDARNPKQLRFPVDVANLEMNLCMKCHYRRANPVVTSSSGPHSPQGPVLLGEAGWFPPNFQYPPGALVGSHGSDRNPKLCAGCHVTRYSVRSKVEGMPDFFATGHSFQAIPCVDQDSVPTGLDDCLITERSFRACASCHEPNGARSALIVRREAIGRYADQIDSMVVRLKRERPAEFSITDNRISTAEGSEFNMKLARERGSAAHNPFLIEALLLASIRQIALDYGIAPPPVTVRQARIATR